MISAMHPDQEDLQVALRLVLAGGPSQSRRALLDTGLCSGRLLSATLPQLRKLGLNAQQCQAFRNPDKARMDRCLHWLRASPSRHFVWWGHANYPYLLKQSPSPPLALFLEGDIDHLLQPAVAIVGSRNATYTGREIASTLARQLDRSGLTVASGMAAGIDAAAHRTCPHSIAVIGTGPDICYPHSHRQLHATLIERGLVATEYPPGTPPRASHFPARNRILAGLSLGVIVVEAARRSGALLTARLAAEAGREVFAVPGSILNPQAHGCHRLLRDGATLLESIDDVLPAIRSLGAAIGLSIREQIEHFHSDDPACNPVDQIPSLDPVHQRIILALEQDPVYLDELALRSGLTVSDLSSILPLLEMEGWVSCRHGRYLRTSRPTTPNASD